MSGLGEAGTTPQLVVWDVCGRKQFFCCIAITLLIRITEAMRAPEQVKKKGWFGLYAMKHSIFNGYYFYRLQYEARAFCLGVWQPPVPITEDFTLHYTLIIVSCHAS